MISYLEYIGLYNVTTPEMVRETYTNTTDPMMGGKYLEYLKEIYSEQSKRQETIENKNSHLVGQASIVISIVALFISLFFEKLNDINLCLKSLIIFLFIVVLVHYFLAIFHSIKTYDIKKYPYSTGATSTITKADRKTSEIDFINEQIKDLVYAVNHNIIQNDKKGANLIFAARCFKLANFYFLFFTLFLLLVMLKKDHKQNEVRITNFSDIKCCNAKDSLIKGNDALIYNNECIQLNSRLSLMYSRMDSLDIKLNILIKDNQKCKQKKRSKLKPPCP